MSTAQRPHVLFVCTANVCRSPLAELTLLAALTGTDGFGSVTVGSAGVAVPAAARICSLVAERRTDEHWRAAADEHVARAATEFKVANAQLILTASRSSRAEIARLVPASRPRLFTLKEAVALGEGYHRDPGTTGKDAVSAFAAYLDSRRGMISTGDDRRRPRHRQDRWSIPDGHNSTVRNHRETLDEVETLTETLASMLSGTADLRSARSRAARSSAA